MNIPEGRFFTGVFCFEGRKKHRSARKNINTYKPSRFFTAEKEKYSRNHFFGSFVTSVSDGKKLFLPPVFYSLGNCNLYSVILSNFSYLFRRLNFDFLSCRNRIFEISLKVWIKFFPLYNFFRRRENFHWLNVTLTLRNIQGSKLLF